MGKRQVAPVTPGEMLEEEFLKPLGLTKYRLAKEIGVAAAAHRRHRRRQARDHGRHRSAAVPFLWPERRLVARAASAPRHRGCARRDGRRAQANPSLRAASRLTPVERKPFRRPQKGPLRARMLRLPECLQCCHTPCPSSRSAMASSHEAVRLDAGLVAVEPDIRIRLPSRAQRGTAWGCTSHTSRAAGAGRTEANPVMPT
jgi:hypothetical protein